MAEEQTTDYVWRPLRDGEELNYHTCNMSLDRKFDVRVKGKSIMDMKITSIQRIGAQVRVVHLGPGKPTIDKDTHEIVEHVTMFGATDLVVHVRSDW